MQESYVVTIARQFGSMGRPIAKKVSEKLGIEFYDRDIVDWTAKSLNLPVSTVSNEEESAKSAFLNMRYPLGMGTTAMQDSIFATQRDLIVELADKGPCVFVGRCADYVLRDRKNIVNVFIYATYEARLHNCVERLNMKPAEAKKMIQAVDRARESYHKHYCGYSMSDREHKHMLLDSSLLGVEGTCDLLVDVVKRKFSLS